MSSLSKLNKPELFEAAEHFGREVPHDATKADLLSALSDITWDEYMDWIAPGAEDEDENSDTESESNESEIVAPTPEEAKEEESAPVEDKGDGEVVVKFTGDNPTYEMKGFRFSKDHPFHTVSREDADYLTKFDFFEESSTDEVVRHYE